MKRPTGQVFDRARDFLGPLDRNRVGDLIRGLSSDPTARRRTR
jgi:hypothetical protein